MSTASPSLSPYHELFGISAERPDHYELLGLPAFTEGDEVIRAAASARLKRIEASASHEPAELCQQIAAEIVAARDYLCRPATKSDYDLQLRRAKLLMPQNRSSSFVRAPVAANGNLAAVAARGTAVGNGQYPVREPALPRFATVRQEVPSGCAVTPPVHESSATREDGPGATLRHHPDYEPVRVIAKGRCDTVFEAFETTLRRKVAIKQLDAEVDELHAALFWREAQFLAACGHPNIITILGSDERRGWIITELMVGNVESKIAQGAMEPDLVRAVLRQALEGLAHFHRQNRIHGEIKPANLLVDDDGYLKLNASPGFQTSDEFRAPLGCQRHVAPELLNPKVFGDVGPAVDLYCLGFTMLELLVGPGIENLFKGVGGEGQQRDLAWLRWHHSHTETLPSLRQLLPDLPDDLVVVLDRLMAKRVSQRFACAEEALDALANAPLLRIPLADAAAGCRRGAGAVIKGKPPAHREYAEQREKSKTLVYQLANSPLVVQLRALCKRRIVRYGLYGMALLLGLLMLFYSSGPCVRHVRVETTPPGAAITINDEATGRQTPCDLDLAVGHHALEFDLQGYEKGKLAIEILPRGDAGPYVCTLVPLVKPEAARSRREDKHLPYPVNIDSVPPGATILFDGQNIPGPGAAGAMRTPGQLELAAGPYDLELRAEGYQPLTATIEVSPDKDNNFKFKLETTVKPPPEADHHDRNANHDRDANKVPELPPATPAPAMPRPPTTTDKLVAYCWKLPEGIGPAERRTYFQQVRLILADAWTQPRTEGLQTADNAFTSAKAIHPDDPRLQFAYGILLQRHQVFSAAKAQLEAAKELERSRQRQWEQRCAHGTAPVDVPFPSPWRQLTRIYLAEKHWTFASSECLDLLRYCTRSHKTIQHFAAAGLPVANDTVTFDMLHENVRFVGHVFGYMQHHCSHASVFSVQPLGRTARLLEMKFEDDAYRRLFRDACGEAAASPVEVSRREEPPAGAVSPEDDPGSALEDLALSLELERNLMFEAIEEAADPAMDTIGATARSEIFPKP